jgi:hypothetical protein
MVTVKAILGEIFRQPYLQGFKTFLILRTVPFLQALIPVKSLWMEDLP